MAWMTGKQWTKAKYFWAKDGHSLNCANNVLFDEKINLLNRIYNMISFCVCGERCLGDFPSLLLKGLLLYLSFHSQNLQWHFRKAGQQDETGKFKQWRESPDLHGFRPRRLLSCCLQDSPSQPWPWCLRSLSIQGPLSWQRKKRDGRIAGCHLCS